MQPGISAQCESGAMVAYVNKSSNGGLVDSFALSPHLDPTCADGQHGSNGTHLWLRLPYTKCGQLVAVCTDHPQCSVPLCCLTILSIFCSIDMLRNYDNCKRSIITESVAESAAFVI